MQGLYGLKAHPEARTNQRIRPESASSSRSRCSIVCLAHGEAVGRLSHKQPVLWAVCSKLKVFRFKTTTGGIR